MSRGCIHAVENDAACCGMPTTSGNDGVEGIGVDPLPSQAIDAIRMVMLMVIVTIVILRKLDALITNTSSVEAPLCRERSRSTLPDARGPDWGRHRMGDV